MLSRGMATEGTKFTGWRGLLGIIAYGADLRRWDMEKVLEVGYTEVADMDGEDGGDGVNIRFVGGA